jgi:asparagine synthase (glutamine-hydrolysing)
MWFSNNIALGFTRLAINGDPKSGHQPHHHNELVGAINGEIYNHQALSQVNNLKPFKCDTQVILPLFERIGPRIIDELDGFYSAVILRPSGQEAICLRDHMGKKPLFVGRSSSELFITSELKILDKCDWFAILPRGVSRVDLRTGRTTLIAEYRPIQVEQDLVQIFRRAVHKRMPSPDLPVGVFLSGGLDSSLVAAFVSKLRDDATYFTLGNSDGPDRRAVETVASALGLRDVRTVSLPHPRQLPEIISTVVHSTESFNPSIVSNGLATYLLAKAAHRIGVKVVLTGEGADELFGGYHSFCRQDPWFEMRKQLIDDMQFTELRRLDLTCMAHSIEPRCPFLDRGIRAFSDTLTYDELYNGDKNKITLRHRFEGVLPSEILQRRKTSFDVGSGIRREVVRYLRRNGKSERAELKAVWEQYFTHDASESYFHAYPAFDDAIDRRGETHR